MIRNKKGLEKKEKKEETKYISCSQYHEISRNTRCHEIVNKQNCRNCRTVTLRLYYRSDCVTTSTKTIFVSIWTKHTERTNFKDSMIISQQIVYHRIQYKVWLYAARITFTRLLETSRYCKHRIVNIIISLCCMIKSRAFNLQ